MVTTTRKRQRARSTTDEPIRGVAYLRLSRPKPGKGNTELTLESQLASCERAVAALGGTIVATEQDVHGGDRLDRAGLWRAVDRVSSGAANTVVVWRHDRLGRDQDQEEVAAYAIERAGGRLLSATEPVSDGPIGTFQRRTYALVSELELKGIRERVALSNETKFHQAQRYRPSRRPPYGYRRDGDTYAVDPVEAGVVRRIFTERAAGASIRSIGVNLTNDKIPSPCGAKQWSLSIVVKILSRETYATGAHRCWQSRTERDADNIPYIVPRDADEHYVVHDFPAIIDLTLWQQAQATAERNVHRSTRSDRRPEVGVLRHGFARCAGCDRAMAVRTLAGRRPFYDCCHHRNLHRPCPAPASITVDAADQHVIDWLQALIEDPSRANAYVVARQAPPDAAALAAAQAAEARVADLEGTIAGQITQLGLLTGAVAEVAARQINALNDELDAARATRDRLVDACRLSAALRPTLVPRDVLATTILRAVEAMIAADPEPEHTFSVVLHVPEGATEYAVPLSWKAWQAALAVLDVRVSIAQHRSDTPRLTTDIRVPGGVMAHGPAYPFSSDRG